jgi:hypothetical protein
MLEPEHAESQTEALLALAHLMLEDKHRGP